MWSIVPGALQGKLEPMPEFVQWNYFEKFSKLPVSLNLLFTRSWDKGWCTIHHGLNCTSHGSRLKPKRASHYLRSFLLLICLLRQLYYGGLGARAAGIYAKVRNNPEISYSPSEIFREISKSFLKSLNFRSTKMSVYPCIFLDPAFVFITWATQTRARCPLEPARAETECSNECAESYI